MISDKKTLWNNFTTEGLPFGIFCGTAMLIVSFWFTWLTFVEYSKESEIMRWQSVSCHIISSKIKESGLEIKYSYQWENEVFENDSYKYGWDSNDRLLESEVLELSEKYKPENPSTCYVNPEDPKDAVLARDEPYFLRYMLIPIFLFVVGGRQVLFGLRRFLRGDPAEHKNGDINDVEFEASETKGIRAKLWRYLTWIGLFTTFVFNFPLALFVSVFLYLITAAMGKELNKMRIKLIAAELNLSGKISNSRITGKQVHFTISEKIVLASAFIIYFVIMVMIAKHNVDGDPFALFGIIFSGVWFGLFMSFIVWMIISTMHGYHYFVLKDEQKNTTVSMFDLPIWSLLLSNVVVIVWAVAERWSLHTILWVYWGESLSIGFFLLMKALAIKEIVNDLGASVRKHRKVLKVLGFLVTYILFHSVYLIFLIVLFEDVKHDSKTVWTIILAIGVFLVQQIISFIYDLIKGDT